MQNHIQTPQLQDAQSFRNMALARAHFMLPRSTQEVLQVRILLRDLNGPRGGVDQECRVLLVTRSRGVLVVTSRAQHASEAPSRALHTAVRTLVKVWQRQRQRDRTGFRAEDSLSSADVPSKSMRPSQGFELQDCLAMNSAPRHGWKATS